MADVTKAWKGLATLNPAPNFQLTRVAAAAIAAGDMVYINSSGQFALADGDADNAAAEWWGIALGAADSGQPVTAAWGVEVRYATGMTPGANLYVSTNAGLLSDAATTGGTIPCAKVTAADLIYILPPIKP
jgi:hypothetical protein